MEKLLCFDLSSKELQNKCGIYIISCNDHTYIGSSKSLYSRLLEHRNDLLNNKQKQEQIQKDYAALKSLLQKGGHASENAAKIIISAIT